MNHRFDKQDDQLNEIQNAIGEALADHDKRIRILERKLA